MLLHLGVTESLSDVVTIARRVSKVDVSPQFDNYSKVVIHVSEDTTYEAGNDTGRTLEIDNPFGTQQMANNMLASLTGYQYQPYSADGALLDPSAEIGDAVNMRGAYGGIYTRERTFGRLMKADVSAPHDEEINHEYQYESPTERKFARQIDDVKASLIIANDRIDASVSQTGGTTSSFGWSLTSNAHRWYANGQEVMAITASGLTVRGNVQATTGTIGGFNITASSLWNNIPYLGATQSSGVYIGNDGIQLGQSFRVDSTGGVTATRMVVDTLYIGGQAVSAATLNARANNGNSAYSWTSNNGSYCTGGVGSWYNAQTTSSSVSYFKCTTLAAGSVSCSSLFSAVLQNCKVRISGSDYSFYRRYSSSIGHYVLCTD